jgi:Membrane domain of glycerophosphoryl diester phosphodiesterase
MDIGSVLGEAWQLYRANWLRFVLTAGLVFVVTDLVTGLARIGGDEGILAGLVWGLIALTITLVGFFWVQGALVETARGLRAEGGADAPLTDAYARTSKHLPALIVGGVIAGLAVGVGLLLLVVPGLYLLTRWSLIVPVIVLEDSRAGASFSRSAQLVAGNGWNVFGVVIVTLVLAIAVRSLVIALLAPLPEFLEGWLGGAIAGALVFPFIAAAWTSMYYRLAEPPA